jgi:hypothetical protein
MDNSIQINVRWWWNKLTNTAKIETSRKMGWTDTFRKWGQLESWEQTADNDDCSAVWSVNFDTGHVPLIDPTYEAFDYRCPACGCKFYSEDLALECV